MAEPRFDLWIHLDNAAFQPFPDHEVARILRDVARTIELGAPTDKYQTVRDVNGNDVGRFGLMMKES